MSVSQPELDAIDLQLLERLQIDASLSNQALAELVHVSPPTCLRRVKRLFDAGLIEREIAVLSVDALAASHRPWPVRRGRDHAGPAGPGGTGGVRTQSAR